MAHQTLSQAVFGSHSKPFKAYFGVYDANKRDFRRINGNLSDATHSFDSIILDAIESIKQNPVITLKNLQEALPKTEMGKVDPRNGHAINIAVQSLIMVNPCKRGGHADGFTIGDYRPTSWAFQEEFTRFVERLFPRNETDEMLERVRVALANQQKLNAWKLKDYYGISLIPTDDLAEHLAYDPENRHLSIFHHTEFLKAQLDKFGHDELSPNSVVRESLRKGSLPRQLLVETLHSLSKILLNSCGDLKSEKFLKRLISEYPEIDRDMKENDVLECPDQYRYWGQRIAALHDVIKSKPPRSRLGRWFERQSTDGNALFIALFALLISIIVGLVSISLAILQTVIAWMAWKYPIK